MNKMPQQVMPVFNKNRENYWKGKKEQAVMQLKTSKRWIYQAQSFMQKSTLQLKF